VLKRLISKAATWVGRRRSAPSSARAGDDPQLDRYIAASLTDETLEWALGTWRQRYL
jgi:hypothetical protein